MTGDNVGTRYGDHGVKAVEAYSCPDDSMVFVVVEDASGHLTLLQGKIARPLPATDLDGMGRGVPLKGLLPKWLGADWSEVGGAVVEAAAIKFLRRAVAKLSDGAAGVRAYVSVYDGPLAPGYVHVQSRVLDPTVPIPVEQRFAQGDDDYTRRRKRSSETSALGAAIAAIKGAAGMKAIEVYHPKVDVAALLVPGRKVYGGPAQAITGVVDSDTSTKAVILVPADWEERDTTDWSIGDDNLGFIPWGRSLARQNAAFWANMGVPIPMDGEKMLLNPDSSSGGKWWGIRLNGRVIGVRFGAVMTAGQSQEIDSLHTEAERLKYIRDKIAEKQGKGYKLVGG